MGHPRWCDEGSAYEIGYLDHGWALIEALVTNIQLPGRQVGRLRVLDVDRGLFHLLAVARTRGKGAVQAAGLGRRTRTLAEPRDELTSARNVVCGSPKSGPPQLRKPEALPRVTRRGFGVSTFAS